MQSRDWDTGQGVKLELCPPCHNQQDVQFGPFQAWMMQRSPKSIGLFPLTSVGFGSDPDMLHLSLFIYRSVCVCVCMNACKGAQWSNFLEITKYEKGSREVPGNKGSALTCIYGDLLMQSLTCHLTHQHKLTHLAMLTCNTPSFLPYVLVLLLCSSHI